MIVIPEEKLLDDICEILSVKLPPVLLEIEEQCADAMRLPAFRYVGALEKLPTGCGLPYALVEVTEGVYTEKDRIIRNMVNTVKIQVKLADYALVWRYCTAIEEAIRARENDDDRVTVEKKTVGGEVWIKVLK